MDTTVDINNESTTVVLTCMADNALSYYWERYNNNDDPSNTKLVGNSSERLVLPNVLPSNSGHYRCVADNMYGKSYSNNATLFIKVLPPAVYVMPMNRTVDKGVKTTFSCIASGVGNSSFTYQWYHNNNPITGEHQSTLTNTASLANSGNYACSVRNRYGNTSISGAALLIILNQYCNEVTESYDGNFTITWNRTLAGATVKASCTGAGLDGIVSRRCTGDNKWKETISCFNEEIGNLLNQAVNLTSSFNELNDTEIISTTGNIATMLANLTSQMTFAEDLSLSVDIVTSLNDATETVVANLTADDAFFEEMATVLDNLLSTANQNNWRHLMMTSPDTSRNLVSGIEDFSRLLGRTLSNNSATATKAKPNIIIKAQLLSNESIQSGVSYMFSTRDDETFTGGDIDIILPNDVLKAQLSPDTMGFPVSGSAVRDNAVPLPNHNNETMDQVPASSIASVQLPVTDFSTLADSHIMIVFDDVNSQNRSCNFYDSDLRGIYQGEVGGWSSNGVELDEKQSNETRVTCVAYHLTSFAVLESVRDQDKEPSSTTAADEALSIITYIGCCISLVCLCISIILLSFIIYRKKKKVNNLFIHLNLCIALALGLIVFVAGIETATNYRGTCVAVAVLLQYFFTSAFCWMLCEGVMLYMMLVTVFGNRLNRQWFFLMLGWGPSIPIVAISVGMAHEHYGTDDYCWIESEDGAILAFIVPIVVIILINCIFLAITLKVLCIDTRKSTDEDNTDKAKDSLKAVVVLLPLLGITWIIGILAVNENTQAFAWIFAILNSLQGVFIFIFYVLRNKQVIKETREHYNFWRRSTVYNFYSRLRSGRGSSTTSPLGVTSKHKASQSSTSDTLGYDKKTPMTSVSSSTAADEDHTKSYKDKSQAPLDDSIFEDNQVKLTTFKKMEESVIVDEDAMVESTMNDDTEKIPPHEVVNAIAVLEKQDSSPPAADFTIQLATH